MGGRLTSSHFVGRLGELAELGLAFRDAADGRPSLVLLGGESGVGKTRLVIEFERRTGEATILRGECLEGTDGELPYAPLLGALRPLVRSRHAALARLSPSSHALLATLLPALGEAAPDLGGPEAAGQMRLFEALLELLDLLGEEQPVVLILEDMHWADRSTRAFTAFLARSLRSERILLLLTYRSDELHRRHPVRPLLAELDRLDCCRRVELSAFDRIELREVLTDILGEAPDDGLLDRLYRRSEGNPLYTEELLAAGLDGRGAAPQSLHDAFILRIERLSPDARRVARAVSAGRRLDETTIGWVCDLESDQLHDALREAVAEQVLVTTEDDRFMFRHALLREALYDDLLPGERVELHRALARALERACADQPDAEVERAAAIATHYAAAGDQISALRATVVAADAARRVHAWGEVAEAAERALELWPRVPESERAAKPDHVDLLALAARAHGQVGEGSRAGVLLAAAIDELNPRVEPARTGALLAQLARNQWHLNRGSVALELAERADALLVVADARADRAALLAWIARTRVLRGRYRDAITDGEVALAAAVEAGDARVEGEVLNTLGMAQIALGQVDAGEAQLRRAIDIARDQDDLDGVGVAYGNLADLLSLAGRTGDALQTALEGIAEVPRRLSRVYDWLTLTISMLAFEAGDWEMARSHLGPARGQVVGTTLIFRYLSEAELALGEQNHELAAECLEAAEPLVRVTSEAQWHGAFGSLCGELRRRNGDLDGARRAVAQALDELEVCTDDVMRIARVTAVGLAVEADRALRARDLRETGDRRDALARGRIHMDRLAAAAQDGGPVERAWAKMGLAEIARARGRNDPRKWEAAAIAWDSLDRRYPAATARWRETEALVEAGDRTAAASVGTSALEVAEGLGAHWLAGELEALMARARLVAGDGPSAPVGGPSNGAGESEPLDPFGLTPRERQVLALVAGGATNRQIGAALFMAEKTASVHVSRILAKLGVQSRTQAAAVAHRLHLS